MNMQAVGTYIKTLRESQGMTALEVGNAAGTNPTYIWRVESASLKSPGMDLLFKIVAAVKGRGDHIMRLMIEENPTDDLARALAQEAQLTPEEESLAGQFFVSDEETRNLLESVLEVSSHDRALQAEIRGYLNGIKARAAGQPSEPPRRTSRRRRSG
jgi:transcriptional regulator with XRE-family HTH domain